MVRPALTAVLVVLAQTASAQPFPAPGTGVYTWERVGDRHLNIESFSFAPGGRLVAATDTVYAFEPAPGGAPAGRWRRLGNPRGTIDAVLALGPDADTVLVGRGNGSLLSRSVDGGATWTNVNGTTPGGGLFAPTEPDAFSVVPAGHAHAGRLLAGGPAIYSDDRGASWADADQSAIPGGGGNATVFAYLPSGRVLMGTGSGVATSDDGGASYGPTPLWGVYAFVRGLEPLATSGSTQSGAPSCGLADGSLCDGAVAVGVDATAPDLQALWTNDGGRTWSAPVPLPQPNDGVALGRVAGVVALAPGPDGLGRAVAVLGRGLVYATADGGRTWAAVGRLPPGDAGHSARLVRLGPDGHLWVSMRFNSSVGEWVYRSAEPAAAAFPVAGETPPGASSDVGVSVRPNPAGGRVEVLLTLAEGGPARVVVVDALGREVAVVLDGEAAAGERPVSADVSSWPAGVYVVRATAGGRVASARLVVAR
jgi:hypothetical protein